MKGAILVLIILMCAVFFSALASGQNALSITGTENSRATAKDADTKKIEERMNKALNEFIVHGIALIDRRNASKVSPLTRASAINSSFTNSSLINSSSINSSMANLPVSPRGIESNSKANFKGYYGITATQHEIGKNNIDSRTFLSGTFALDKSVKFQDRDV